MFIGHYGIALAAKSRAPQVSLGWLFLATQWLDLIWPIFVLLGLERFRIESPATGLTPLVFTHYPFSHSLLAVAGWSILLGAAYRWKTRDRGGFWIVGLLVLSHWILDAVAHRPDLQLYPGSSVVVGLGLWDSAAATLVVEGAIALAGVLLYVRTTVARDRVGSIGFWLLVAFLGIIYVANLFGPPPPSIRAVAVSALALWLLAPWAGWVDGHRTASQGRHERHDGMNGMTA